MPTAYPRMAHKEVRQVAEWLEDHGWQYDTDDAKGHTIWRWPRTGQTIKLPSTPSGQYWVRAVRTDACKIMGIHGTNKRKPRDYVPTKPHAGLVITRAHQRQMLAWVDECKQELSEAAKRNGNDGALRMFELFAYRLKQIIDG